MRMKISDWEVMRTDLGKETDWKFEVLNEHIGERIKGKRPDAIMAIGIPTPLLRTVLQVIAKHNMTQYRRETVADPETGDESLEMVPFTIDIPLEDSEY